MEAKSGDHLSPEQLRWVRVEILKYMGDGTPIEQVAFGWACFILLNSHPPTDITRSQEEGITRQVAAQLVHLGLSRAEQSPLPRTDEWISMLDEHARKYLTANVYDPSDPFSKPPAESGPRE